jgi:hypothetical protein
MRARLRKDHAVLASGWLALPSNGVFPLRIREVPMESVRYRIDPGLRIGAVGFKSNQTVEPKGS